MSVWVLLALYLKPMDMVITGGKGQWEEVERGIGGMNGDGRRLDLGW